MTGQMTRTFALAAALAAGLAASAAAEPGVTKDEVVIGTVGDLTGPSAPVGVPVRQAMDIAIEQINEKGGIHGRKLRLVFEDSGYDPRKAILATRKLLSQDQVFAIVSQTGSTVVKATLPLVEEAGRPFLFPFANIPEIVDPPRKLVASAFPDNIIQVTSAMKFAKEKLNAKRFCAFYQDDELGEQVMRGMQRSVDLGYGTLGEVTSFKRGATDFSSQMARLKAGNCDVVMFGTVARDAAAAVIEKQKIGFTAPVIVTQASSGRPLLGLAGDAAEGVYSTTSVYLSDAVMKAEPMATLNQRYMARYGKPIDEGASAGFIIMAMVAEAMKNAGPNLTAETMMAGIDKLTDFQPGIGYVPMTFRANKRLGSGSVYILQIKNKQVIKLDEINN